MYPGTSFIKNNFLKVFFFSLFFLNFYFYFILLYSTVLVLPYIDMNSPQQVFTELVTVLLLLFVLFFWLQGKWGLNSLTRDRTHTPCAGR